MKREAVHEITPMRKRDGYRSLKGMNKEKRDRKKKKERRKKKEIPRREVLCYEGESVTAIEIKGSLLIKKKGIFG